MTALLGVTGGFALVVSALLMLRAPETAVTDLTAAAQAPDTRAPAGGTRATVGDAITIGAPTAPTRAKPAASGFLPDRLVIPRLSVDAAVVAMSVGADGSLGVPDDPAVLGWWRQGAMPGRTAGSVVIDGHVDSARAGPGALFHLRSLVPGDVVTVRGNGRSQGYVVVARRQYPKASLPTAVFDQQVGARLVLISCGGRFDRGTRHYADNVVVFARPA